MLLITVTNKALNNLEERGKRELFLNSLFCIKRI
nr:MAG TPA: hypothetical protein [Caudoviricetes sp.]